MCGFAPSSIIVKIGFMMCALDMHRENDMLPHGVSAQSFLRISLSKNAEPLKPKHRLLRILIYGIISVIGDRMKTSLFKNNNGGGC